MDLRDALLMILAESAAYPGRTGLVQSAIDQLDGDGQADYRVLSELVGEASGKGVLRTIHRKYGPDAGEAVFGPILREIDWQKPVPPRRSTASRPVLYAG